mmetsp:Transcript_115336/g.246506  ORF Transcript_115336/g.246506 Transcript_115336/m.246506 type:complete len:84 (-) Transcript_115336:101-352(-)
MAWALAKLALSDAPLLNSIASAAIPLISEFNSQDLANTPWAFAKREVVNRPLCGTSMPLRPARTPELNPQNQANIAWSCAILQ